MTASADNCNIRIFRYLDYILPWEIPGPADLSSLNLLKSSLRVDADINDVIHAISFLKTAIVDFPAEYFLQPPYIFQVMQTKSLPTCLFVLFE